MKIALLTIWKVGNYGAEMQTYATVKALQKLGHEVVVLDYRLKEERGVRTVLNTTLASLTPAHRKFEDFWKYNIPSSKHFRTEDELKNGLPSADLYLVGSDQVWNPAITKDRCLDFFLSFAPNNAKRAAYASSIGVSEWTADSQLTDRIKTELQKFDSVSCRESDGVKILKNVFNIDATHVLDPTLLFDGYPELTGTTTQKNTFVYYPLFGGRDMEDFCKETAINLGMEYIDNNYRKFWLQGRTWDRPSMSDWIRNFAEGKIVATQSFHGTAFSLIHRKQFFTVYNGSKVSRMKNLLEALGVSDRLYPTVEAAREARPWEHSIDYTEVDKRLQVLRDTSWGFLRNL